MTQAGRVQESSGLVTAKGLDGQARELKVGDIIYENELVETATGASVSIIQDDGNLIELAADEKLFLDDSVSDVIAEDVVELQEALTQALENEGDIEDALDEAPAASEKVADSYDERLGWIKKEKGCKGLPSSEMVSCGIPRKCDWLNRELIFNITE